MSSDANFSDFVFPATLEALPQYVPGTSVVAGAANMPLLPGGRATSNRDPRLRRLYAEAALSQIPHMLGAMDRNPYRPTYGCMDRAYWHYRTSDFPSEMYQEGVWPLALIYSIAFPGNRWHGDACIRELAVAGMRFAARSSHRDGSCDDYYPFERAFGAAAFSLLASAQAYRLLGLEDAEIVAWLQRRAAWLSSHDESGRLANHHALSALAIAQVWKITGNETFHDAADRQARLVHAWQSPEGWFEEYGGADPGYQTVTIDALVKYRRLTESDWLDEPLQRATQFAHWFLHPDGSYAGTYGSRGTCHFYPHGFELLSRTVAAAADLVDGFLGGLRDGTEARFDDDRMFIHRLGNLIEAYRDWSPRRAVSEMQSADGIKYFPRAQILVDRSGRRQTIVSAARGGVFKHFAATTGATTDAGLIVETTEGRVAASQTHGLRRTVRFSSHSESPLAPVTDRSPRPMPHEGSSRETLTWQLTVEGALDWTRFEVATPARFAALRLAMIMGGRWFRTAVRRFLQRRVVTGQGEAPIRLNRRLTRINEAPGEAGLLRVEDEIELTDPRIKIRRLSFAADLEVRYTAAANVYQSALLRPWHDLDAGQVETLNRERRLRVIREFKT